jgi:hypothetical protein
MRLPAVGVVLGALLAIAGPASAAPSFPSPATARATAQSAGQHLVVHGFTPRPAGVHMPTAQVASYNSAWSGWSTNPITTTPPYPSGNPIYVQTSFTVPTADCAAARYGANGNEAVFWAGLDGTNLSSRLEQTGTGESCSQGTPNYWAWYEWYPAAPVVFGGVRPGDSIHVQLGEYESNGAYYYTAYLADSTSGGYFSAVSPPCTSACVVPPSSAEVITEAPGGGPSRGWDLTPFSGGPNYSFTAVKADDAGSLSAGTWYYLAGDKPGYWTTTEQIQTDTGTSSGTALAPPSALDATGSFNTPFQYAGPAR